MPSAISRDSSSMRTPWNRKNASTSSPTGVRMRWVNSCPVTGTMLKVGFSAALAPRLSDSTSVPEPSWRSPPMPPDVSKLKVAAMLEVTVKCGGRSRLRRARLSSRMSWLSAFTVSS